MIKFMGWIVIKDNHIPQGLDYSSGGYPFDVKYISDLKIFGSKEQAEEYTKTMNGTNKSYGDFKAVFATITLTWSDE